MQELRNEVREILESMVDDNTTLERVLFEVLEYGCVSGCVPALIYYYQTEAFFERHCKAINELAHQISEDCWGDPFRIYKQFIRGCSKNEMAWFGFEEVARQIAWEEGFDI